MALIYCVVYVGYRLRMLNVQGTHLLVSVVHFVSDVLRCLAENIHRRGICTST